MQKHLRSPAIIGLLTATIGLASLIEQPAQGMITPAAPSAREISALVALSQTMQQANDNSSQDMHAATRVAAISSAPRLLAIVDQADILSKHRILADRMLRKLPAGCRNTVKIFIVNYDHPSNRGLGGASTIMIDGSVPDSEFESLLVHECGHVFDIGTMRGTPGAGQTAFFDNETPIYADDDSLGFYRLSWVSANGRRKGSKDADFVSGYAKTDVFEDFAETFIFYALHRDQFEKLAAKNTVLKAKYDWMATHVFSGSTDIAYSTTTVKRQPWDITKLGFAWVN